ncbi:MAG: MopE-related protein, partial [Myxococcota bacterium]|nr:MopE-related protein [Myxococcota bacterium]
MGSVRSVLLLLISLSSCTRGGDAAKEAAPRDAVGIADSALPDDEWDRDGDGHTTDAGDCDDDDPAIHPGAAEVCNEMDDDCDGAIDEGVMLPWWPDADGDGHGAGTAVDACEAPEGAAGSDDDCDDSDPGISPSAVERCNGVDDDCDGGIDEDVLVTVYADADGDGWGDAASPGFGCPDDPGTTTMTGDCDDDDPYVHPGIVGDA